MKIRGKANSENIRFNYELTIENYNPPWFYKFDDSRILDDYNSVTAADYKLRLWNENFDTTITDSYEAIKTLTIISDNRKFSTPVKHFDFAESDDEIQLVLKNAIIDVLTDEYGVDLTNAFRIVNQISECIELDKYMECYLSDTLDFRNFNDCFLFYRLTISDLNDDCFNIDNLGREIVDQFWDKLVEIA